MTTELTLLLPALRRFAYSLTGNMADADDLLQSTVVKLLDSPPAADVPLLQWSFRVCRNLWIDDYRAKKVRQHTALDEAAELSGEDGEQVAINEITLTEVNQAMNNLPGEQREVLSLVAVQGMSYSEAAGVLAIPQGTIMSRLARARVAMVDALKYSGVLA
ncbi:RNA polymerase sigma factor [Rheinheimera aquimaris]|uniref:RNA polymerase sigma factor n=1 Tax=Rheinheimera aquimaris TaxID=412437 RepID=A0ABP3PHW3_9GAMM|nr:sigma-70 family RNA polymerase sigma factor [Rheinheimera aquimaris]MCB5215509.1 sigma-70 family RNA polymerase sigma factor [Rheinheimera aquimaris]